MSCVFNQHNIEKYCLYHFIRFWNQLLLLIQQSCPNVGLSYNQLVLMATISSVNHKLLFLGHKRCPVFQIWHKCESAIVYRNVMIGFSHRLGIKHQQIHGGTKCIVFLNGPALNVCHLGDRALRSSGCKDLGSKDDPCPTPFYKKPINCVVSKSCCFNWCICTVALYDICT